ncbi:MAG: hypothetical protein D6803_01665 [Anaerolineae bacterium]|nr:MAG: hypothetical protein D6803_01665 [Anaerolineae bacterium]
MKQLRNSILLLVLVGGIFLNIERLDVGNTPDVVDMQSFVYVLGGVIVLVHLLLEGRWQPSVTFSLVLWWLVYLALKVLLFNQRPLLGGTYTYLTVTEMAMLGLLTVACWRLSRDLGEVRETIANVTLEDVSDRVKTMEEAEREIAREITRSRRYNSPLSVLVLRVNPGEKKLFLRRSAEELFEGLLERYAANKLMRVLDRELRRTDLVIDRSKQNEIVLVLPETGGESTATLTERIRHLVKENLGFEVETGYASFPDEALTFEELVDQAKKRFRLISSIEAESKDERS